MCEFFYIKVLYAKNLKNPHSLTKVRKGGVFAIFTKFVSPFSTKISEIVFTYKAKQ